MTRENRYIIEILFENNDRKKNLFNGNVPYFGSPSFTDAFVINTDKITIEANRSAIIQLEGIFYNHFSSIYNQIIKALLFYYASTRKFAKIKSLLITRTRSRQILAEKQFKDEEFSQVLTNSFKLNYTIDPVRLCELFKETPKGITILISVSYLLSANSALNENDKFEKLWKGFNKLFAQIGNYENDFNCLRKLKQFIVDNPGILPLSSNKVHGINTKRLRNSIRWRAMLLDFYDTERKTGGLKDFILRYNDKRIMEILLETKYGFREDFLRRHGFFTQVDNHIKHSIASNIINDDEIVTLLTGKYMYFVRNKTFHGEKIDFSFKLSVNNDVNKEQNELKFLNSILEPYLIDLINASHIYP